MSVRCVGGPIDGEVRVIEDGYTRILVPIEHADRAATMFTYEVRSMTDRNSDAAFYVLAPMGWEFPDIIGALIAGYHPTNVKRKV